MAETTTGALAAASSTAGGTPPGGLPPFWCPVESAVHPAVRRIEERAVAWLDASGVFTDAADRAWNLASNAAEFSCRLAPSGDEERLLLFAQWTYWLFALDDTRLDAGPSADRSPDVAGLGLRLVRSLEAPGSGMLGSGPMARALDDLVVRTRAATGPVQFQRLADGVRDLLLGAAWQQANAGRGVVPSPAEYAAGRIADVGTRFDAAFVEIAGGAGIPGDLLHSGPVRALTEATGFIAACDNDLLSAAKEAGEKTAAPNLVRVLAHHHRCSERQALAAALSLRDRAMTLFLRLRERTARLADEALRRYLDDLGHWIAGNIRWSDTAPRYASPRHLHPLPVAGATLGVTLRQGPADARPGPPGLSTIDWWWDQLGG
ncbi:terpene synthase family protein [Streptomyces xinghaiensis]|uniref:terpene synthase family protein n=1 Tax=Streptomyces xinghaiensis TaxID=1038928 RepID=UPI001EDE78D5|nr:hypothetical protein [Streptomyces xinghaiensis]